MGFMKLFFLSIFPLLSLAAGHSSVMADQIAIRNEDVIVHRRVSISDIAKAQRVLRFPFLIQLLFGNFIQDFKYVSHHFLLMMGSHNITISPLRRRRSRLFFVRLGGFVFKQSTPNAHPVPMENCKFLFRLSIPESSKGYVHLWLISQGTYSGKQRLQQRLYTSSLIGEYADNIQRALGVADCSNTPTVSGLCNNEFNSVSGVTFQDLLQPFKHNRAKTKDLLKFKPTPRFVSNRILRQRHSKPAAKNVNMLMIFFGQFLDHEITLTPEEMMDHEREAPISNENSKSFMNFERAAILRYQYKRCCGTYSKARLWYATAFNKLTSFIDGGAVYGSDHLRSVTLRAWRYGRLILYRRGREKFLPLNTLRHLPFKLPNAGGGDSERFSAAGDVRANENPFLLSIHTIFAREHNRVVLLIRRHLMRTKRRELLYDDEWLFQTARKIVIAEMQCITFQEFVPLMLGDKAIGDYDSYDSKIDARISTFHSSFAYRWGHSGVVEKIRIRDRHGRFHTVELKDLFFKPEMLHRFGIDNLIKAAMSTRAANIDEQIVNSLRNFLFSMRRGGMDLGAFNIQRNRDLGIPNYLSVQEFFKTGSNVENIRPDVLGLLRSVYGDKKKFEAFVAGLAEKRETESLMGRLFTAVNAEQFKRLRDGDRFYFENLEWDDVIKELDLVKRIENKQIQFADIVFANTRVHRRHVGQRSSIFKV